MEASSRLDGLLLLQPSAAEPRSGGLRRFRIPLSCERIPGRLPGQNRCEPHAMTPSNLSTAEAPYVAIFTIQVKPEHRDHFLEAITRAMAHSAKEPGVVSFNFLVDR